jgi:hypothetical protein
MSGELKWLYATEVVLEGSGGSAASNAFVAADDTSLAAANHNDYPFCDFALTCDFGGAVAPGGNVNLYRQDFDINAAGSDAPAPATTYKHRLVGSFVIPSGQSASATYPCPNVPVSHTCKFSVENVTGQNLIAGWLLKATPKTYSPVA